MTSGRAALLCFAAVIVTAVWRKPLGIPYDAWRLAHAADLAGLHWPSGTSRAWTNTSIRRGEAAAVDRVHLSWVLLIVYVRAFKPWHMRKTPLSRGGRRSRKPATPGRSRCRPTTRRAAVPAGAISPGSRCGPRRLR